MPQNQIFKGALYLSFSCLLFAFMGVLIREISSSVNTETIVFARNILGLILILPIIARKGFQNLKTEIFHLHLVRSIVGVSAMYCFFYAIAHLPLADAMLFTYAAPVFTPVIAYFWLKEAITSRTYFAVIVGLVGVILVIKPGSGLMAKDASIGLLACFLAAMAYVSVRRLTLSESAQKIVFYYCLNASFLSTLPLMMNWQPVDLPELSYLLAIAFLATLSQLFLSKAYSYSPAGQIGPISYSAIFYAGLLAWILWDEVPDLFSIMGISLVVISGFITLDYPFAKTKVSKYKPE